MWRHCERLGRSPWRVDASECGIFDVVSNPAGHGAENVAEDARGGSDLDGFSTQEPHALSHTTEGKLSGTIIQGVC